MLMMGKFKEDVLLAVDHAFLVLVPEWEEGKGPINEYLAGGASLAVAAFVRGTLAERKGTVLPEAAFANLAGKLTEGLPSQVPADANPATIARIATPGAEAFRAAYPEGSTPRTLADEALAAYVEGTPEP